MATWKDIKNFIDSNYNGASVEKDIISLTLRIDGNRTQIVHLTPSQDKEWLHIFSAIGEFDSDEIEDLLLYATTFNCGGVCMIDDDLYYRHSTLMDDLSTNELVLPMETVAIAADTLEKKFIGGDAN